MGAAVALVGMGFTRPTGRGRLGGQRESSPPAATGPVAAGSGPAGDLDAEPADSAGPRAQLAAATLASAPEPVVPPGLLLARRGLEALRAGLLVVGPRDVLVLANPSAHRLGLVRDGEIAHAVLRTLAGRVRGDGETRDVELDLPRGTGGWLGVRACVVDLTDGYVSIEVEDITEAHRLARVRRDFVANVSHELKTPVGALQLLSEALVDAVDDPEAARRFTDRINHESRRLGRLVSELLELSRLQGAGPLPSPEPVAVDRVLAEVLDRSRTAAAAKEIDLDASAARGLVLYGDEGQVVTALANLVDNAIAYSPEHTTVTIGASRRARTIELTVADQGMGIAARDLDRIFERFYRADPARSRATGGTGLGLAIVKHIVSNHGGEVSVCSTPGEGSTFTLRLPARPPSAAEVGEPAGRSGTGESAPVSVEDSPPGRPPTAVEPAAQPTAVQPAAQPTAVTPTVKP